MALPSGAQVEAADAERGEELTVCLNWPTTKVTFLDNDENSRSDIG